MALSRRRAPVRGAATQGVARGSAPATSRGSAPSGYRRSTESSGFTASESDFGSPASGSAPVTPASAARGPSPSGPAAPAPAATLPAATAPTATALAATYLAATAPAATAPTATPIENLFRQFMQAYMEDRRNSAPAPVPAPLAGFREDVSNRPLKTRNLDLYYGNSHMECYHFCQQCEDHFETVGAKGHKRVPFATSFLKYRILHC